MAFANRLLNNAAAKHRENRQALLIVIPRIDCQYLRHSASPSLIAAFRSVIELLAHLTLRTGNIFLVANRSVARLWPRRGFQISFS